MGLYPKASGKELQKYLNTPLQCIHCHIMLNRRRDGYYQCPSCKTVYKDNLTVAKEFLFENPDATFDDIVEGTHLTEEIVLYFIDNKMLIIPNTNKNFHSCKTCGRMIINGRYCNNCAILTFNQIQGAFDEEQ